MAFRLVDRNKQIPGGLLYYEPRVPNWKPPPFPSFTTLVDTVIGLRQQHPELGLSTDRVQVEFDVDSFNANVCRTMGWNQYIVDDAAAQPPPLLEPPLQPMSLGNRVANVVAGAETVLGLAKENAIPREQANARASICKECPMNGKGDILRYFTLPLATAIRKSYQLFLDMGLTTDHDDDLGICDACDCPLKLKIHYPIKMIRDGLKQPVIDRLHSSCWIRHESQP